MARKKTPVAEEATKNISALPGPANILGRALQIYKAGWKTLISVELIPILIGFLLVLPLIIYLIIGHLSGLNVGPKPLWFLVISIILIILGVIIVLAVVLASLLSQAALLCAIRDNKENIGVKEAYRRGRNIFASYWWLVILSGLIMMGGYMLFLIPGIVFSVWFSLALFVLACEDLKGTAALSRSREYVKGRWWGVFWRFIFLGLVMAGFYICYFIVLGILSLILKFSGVAFASQIYEALNQILSIAASLLIAPLTLAYTFTIYNDLKATSGRSESAAAGKRTWYVIGAVWGIVGTILLVGGLVFGMIALGGVLGNSNNDTIRKADLSVLQEGLGIYASYVGAYPASLDEMSDLFEQSSLTIPVDPATNLPYEYQAQSGGQSYQLCAALENKEKLCVDEKTFLTPPVQE